MKKLAVFLGGTLLASWGPAAYGAMQISYSINNAAPTICANVAASGGPANCAAFSGSGVSVLALGATSNSPGTPNLSQTFGATLFISTTTAAKLEIWISSQDFTVPVTPPDLIYRGSTGITQTTGAGTVGSTHCIDTTNGLTPPTSTFCSAGTALINAPLSYAGGSGSETDTTLISSLTTPPAFSMSQHITMILGAGSNINVITSSSLTQVPEPMSIALLGGVVLLTSGAIRRKRNQNLNKA